MKAAAAFLIGALLAGYAVWELKPSSVDSLALGALERLAADRAAAARAIYEREQVDARDALAVVTAQLETARAARREAEAQAGTADATARQSRAAIAEAEARVRQAQAVTETARLDAQSRSDSRRALAAVSGAQAVEIEAQALSLRRVRAALEGAARQVDLERAVSRALRVERDAATAQTAVVARQRDLAMARVADLDGRRLRWGPGVTAGVAPFGRRAPAVVVGLTLLWGR